MLLSGHAVLIDKNGIVKLMNSLALSVEGAGNALVSVHNITRSRYLMEVRYFFTFYFLIDVFTTTLKLVSMQRIR